MKKVLVGMSGGVDSSVCALLLKEQGYEVEGLFMKNWDSALNNDILGNPSIDNNICPEEQDYLDAKSVCGTLNIKLHRVNFVKEYWNFVFEYFLDEYKKGRTPNPDIMCNKYIKFLAFIKEAEKLGFDNIAMGHYARIECINKEHFLLRGIDSNKDQSYFLSQLSKNQLKKVIFPIGNLEKSEVRRIAEKYNLSTFNKKDSTGICFIGERDFNKFLSNYILAKKGKMLTLDGEEIGTHNGLIYYTIGQRKGLGIGGNKKYSTEPWFCIGKDIKNNVLFVGQGFHNDYLYSTSCIIDELNIIGDLNTDNLTAKFRYRQSDNIVSIKKVSDDSIIVSFKEPIRAVTPGQSCVFYNGDICLGGGIIKEVYKEDKKMKY